jgi:ribosomal protein S8E
MMPGSQQIADEIWRMYSHLYDSRLHNSDGNKEIQLISFSKAFHGYWHGIEAVRKSTKIKVITSEHSGMWLESGFLSFAAVIEVDVSEFGCSCHDLASFQGIVGL